MAAPHIRLYYSNEERPIMEITPEQQISFDMDQVAGRDFECLMRNTGIQIPPAYQNAVEGKDTVTLNDTPHTFITAFTTIWLPYQCHKETTNNNFRYEILNVKALLDAKEEK